MSAIDQERQDAHYRVMIFNELREKNLQLQVENAKVMYQRDQLLAALKKLVTQINAFGSAYPDDLIVAMKAIASIESNPL